MSLANKYDSQATEQRYQEFWKKKEVFKWQSDSNTEDFIIDTPPPTVSGSLHLGHVFSYTQTDIIARYQRMLGKNVFYPMGWDDNGLPTERRVQNYFGIKCNPNVPYNPEWKPNYEFDHKKDEVVEVSRENFIETCAELTKEDEKVYEALWQRLTLSVDWEQTYETINKHCIKISQLSFLDLAEKNLAYNAEAPTMWDTDFQTAIAQAELEDRERPGAYHDLKFKVRGGEDFIISTTRPELLPACIAVVAHPEDARYQKYFGKTAITPLFHAPVPICPSSHADPEKGSGILMICTFGDIADVDWWKQSDLAIKQIIARSGKLLPVEFGKVPFESENPEVANKNYKQLEGLYIKQAQKKIVELLTDSGDLQGKPKVIQHPVKFYEKGDRPLEFIPTRQWFVNTLDHKKDLIEQGRKIKWHPEFMLTRYENWVNGLNQDWCISRQRYFGVPFPVWYSLNKQGEPDYENPIYASKEKLPLDPSITVPPGYTAEQRNQPGGFMADPDVMDTWATSSMTPQISSHWGLDKERHQKLYPANIRPQAHEIIRTWAFYTIVKSWFHEKQIPWKDILISGWVLDPDRKKMSKSKGNVITPQDLFDKYSADAIRYWAGKAKLGGDTAIEEAIFKIGGKLTNKLFNAAKFVLMQFERVDADISKFNPEDITAELDKALIDKLKNVLTQATAYLDNFDYSNALRITEDAFWDFCDNYLELVKVRSYQDEDNKSRRSAFAALSWSLKTFIRLFAPFMPYVTEEIWQATFVNKAEISVHKAKWPTKVEIENVAKPENTLAYESAIEVIGKIRGQKTTAQKSLKWEVEKLNIICKAEVKSALETVLEDLLKAGNVIPEGVSFEEKDATEGNADITLSFNENWSAK